MFCCGRIRQESIRTNSSCEIMECSAENLSAMAEMHEEKAQLEQKVMRLEQMLQQMEERMARMEIQRRSDESLNTSGLKRLDEDRITSWGPERRDEQASPSSLYQAVVPTSPMPYTPSGGVGGKVFNFDFRTLNGNGNGINGNGNGFRTSPPPYVPQTPNGMNGFHHPPSPKPSLPDVPENIDDRIAEVLRNPAALNIISNYIQAQGVPSAPNPDPRGNSMYLSNQNNNIPLHIRRNQAKKQLGRSSIRRFSCPDASRITNWIPPPASAGYARTPSYFGGPEESLGEIGSDDVFLPNDQVLTRAGLTVKELEIICRFGEMGQGPGQLNAPHGFCLGLGEEIIVADTNNHRIQFFSKEGKFIGQWGTTGKRDGQLWYPRKVAFMPETQRLVVCDRGQDRSRLQIFTRFGIHERSIGVDYVAIVAGMTVYKDQIVIVDSVNPTCIVLDLQGTLRFWFSCQQHMKEPSDVAVANNLFYICDFKGHNVCTYNGKGEFLSQIGSQQYINFPNGISVAPDGMILVGDSHGNRFHVAAFSPEGRFLAEYECPHMKVSRCCGLVLNSQGYVMTIAKNNNFVLVLNRSETPLPLTEVGVDRDSMPPPSPYC